MAILKGLIILTPLVYILSYLVAKIYPEVPFLSFSCVPGFKFMKGVPFTLVQYSVCVDCHPSRRPQHCKSQGVACFFFFFPGSFAY